MGNVSERCSMGLDKLVGNVFKRCSMALKKGEVSPFNGDKGGFIKGRMGRL